MRNLHKRMQKFKLQWTSVVSLEKKKFSCCGWGRSLLPVCFKIISKMNNLVLKELYIYLGRSQVHTQTQLTSYARGYAIHMHPFNVGEKIILWGYSAAFLTNDKWIDDLAFYDETALWKSLLAVNGTNTNQSGWISFKGITALQNISTLSYWRAEEHWISHLTLQRN